jgi:hypothetical protein
VADATIPQLKQEYASNRNMPWWDPVFHLPVGGKNAIWENANKQAVWIDFSM